VRGACPHPAACSGAQAEADWLSHVTPGPRVERGERAAQAQQRLGGVGNRERRPTGRAGIDACAGRTGRPAISFPVARGFSSTPTTPAGTVSVRHVMGSTSTYSK